MKPIILNDFINKSKHKNIESNLTQRYQLEVKFNTLYMRFKRKIFFLKKKKRFLL